MASVTLKNVGKKFGGVAAVENISLTIAEGEFVALVGPSGCGKSTTLRMIAGLEGATEGEIWIGDRLANDIHAADRDVAMVFQNYALYPHMTVFNNIAYGLRRRGFLRGEIDSRVAEAANLLQLGDLLQRRPAQLSGGQRQRVALGRAIVRRPAVLLMDEPLSNLDTQLRAGTRAELLRLHQRLRTTTIYVTHDQVEAMTMAERVVIMNGGRIEQVGRPLDVHRQPDTLFAARFLGMPQINTIDGILKKLKSGARFTSSGVGFDLPGVSLGDGAVCVAIRPQFISTRPPSSGRQKDSIKIGSALAEIVEHYGSESYATVSCGVHKLVVVIDPGATVEPGERFDLWAEQSRLLIYAQATGGRINLPAIVKN